MPQNINTDHTVTNQLVAPNGPPNAGGRPLHSNTAATHRSNSFLTVATHSGCKGRHPASRCWQQFCHGGSGIVTFGSPCSRKRQHLRTGQLDKSHYRRHRDKTAGSPKRSIKRRRTTYAPKTGCKRYERYFSDSYDTYGLQRSSSGFPVLSTILSR